MPDKAEVFESYIKAQRQATAAAPAPRPPAVQKLFSEASTLSDPAISSRFFDQAKQYKSLSASDASLSGVDVTNDTSGETQYSSARKRFVEPYVPSVPSPNRNQGSGTGGTDPLMPIGTGAGLVTGAGVAWAAKRRSGPELLLASATGGIFGFGVGTVADAMNQPQTLLDAPANVSRPQNANLQSGISSREVGGAHVSSAKVDVADLGTKEGDSHGPVKEQGTITPDQTDPTPRRLPDGTLAPPGTCSDEQYEMLSTAAQKACPRIRPACSPLDTCPELRAKAAVFRGCAVAQKLLNDTCFEGGDKGHKQKADDAVRAALKCEQLLAANPECKEE